MTMSPENRERLRIGAAIAKKLTPLKSPVEVAAEIGVSTTRLRQIECIALWKLQKRLQELTGREVSAGDLSKIEVNPISPEIE
jgi:DNA-directed RNA polymerase sigma subunit (sigma70/sigma32)